MTWLATCLWLLALSGAGARGEDYSLSGAKEDAPGREQGNQLSESDVRRLPMYTTLNGSVTNLDEIRPAIHLNRTKAYLNCSQGSMQVQLEFKEPFYGLAYADFDRNSACLSKGRGLNTAYIELPLKGCGTRQDPLRVFTNNIVVRFHPDFEIDGDEVITIVCRYPPAVAIVPLRRLPSPAPPLSVTGPVLSPFHILLMICTLLFLALLLTGLGCSYICLRRRPVRILERAHTSGSEITKAYSIDGSSGLSRLSVFDNFQIPRVHGTQQIYGSEAHLVAALEPSDTLPSDYPSESHSEVEQRASSSLYSETINELESTRVSQTTRQLELPKFDVQMRVKPRAPLPPASPLPSESEASLALERNLTTILEREESSRLSSFAYAPELHQPPPPGASRQQTPPVYSRILRKQQQQQQQQQLLQTESETRSLTEVTDATHAKYRVATMLAPQPGAEEVEPLVQPVVAARRPEITTHEVDDVFLRTVTEKKTIEDVERHRRQVTEYRQQQLQQQQPAEPKWDVTIRNYPSQPQLPPAPPDWENFSDVSSASNLTFTHEQLRLRSEPPKPSPQQLQQPPPTLGEEPEPHDEHIQPTYTQRSLVEEREQLELEERSAGASSWYRLERVLEPQYAAELSEDERGKWRQIITTESTLRTLLSEAVLREDYELIRKDERYTSLFPAAKWDVIIRIISPAAVAADEDEASDQQTAQPGQGPAGLPGRSGQRYKRQPGGKPPSQPSDWDNRSRRSSLPTLYEYESDAGSFAQEQLRQAAHAAAALPGARVRRLSSTTRGGSEADLRSMSEMTVRDFARLERDLDQTSLSSYDGAESSLVRSLSQPSLARSGSEFTEHWAVPARQLPTWATLDDEAGPVGSADSTPRALRRQVDQATTAISSSSGGGGGSTSFSQRQLRVQQTSSEHRASSWFHDDSEPEMQI